MGLFLLILGLFVFFGVHTVTTMRKQRAALIARLGEGTYKAVYALLSFVGLALIIYGFGLYRASGMMTLLDPPAWTRHVAALLVWPAFILVTASYIRGNIYRALKHPMLAGVKLWALAHLIANGDLGSIILFGSVLAWAVYDRISLKRRTDAGAPPLPLGGVTNDIIAVVVGTFLYFVFGVYLHPYLIGVPAFGSY